MTDDRENLADIDAGGAAARAQGLSRRAAIGSVTGLALASSSSSQGRFGEPYHAVEAGHRAIPGDVVDPERYGAIGDGTADDTAALQTAFDTGRSVRLTSGRTYLIASGLRLSANDVTVTGGGQIKISRKFDLASDRDGNGTHMRALFVTGANATIIGVTFDAADAPVGGAVENGLIWSTAPFTTIRDCSFVGNPKGTCIWGRGDAPYMSVQGCRFQNCSGAVFVKGRNSIISGNIIINATDAAIAINGRSCTGAVVANNTISNENLAPIPSMIAVEEGANSWTITGNTLVGVNGGGIICLNVLDSTRVKAGVIADNVIDARAFDGRLPTNKNPAALLAISGNYMEWAVHGNTLTACPTGNSNSRLAIFAASGGVFSDNIIDARGTIGLSATIEISAEREGVNIRYNTSYAASGGRHYLFGPGEYSEPCRFKGGSMLYGQEGINAELSVKSMRRLVLEIDSIEESTTANLINAFTLLGDRCVFLNGGAWARPHRVGRHTDMYAINEPKNAGVTPFQIGDRFHFMNPRSGGGVGLVRIDGGWMRF